MMTNDKEQMLATGTEKMREKIQNTNTKYETLVKDLVNNVIESKYLVCVCLCIILSVFIGILLPSGMCASIVC